MGLSTVVSRQIGETEKHLGRLFGPADCGAILCFDEPDALLGKRTDVCDGHDRYANAETAYFLQCLESYRGLSILATNRKGALDAAFTRLPGFVIDFL